MNPLAIDPVQWQIVAKSLMHGLLSLSVFLGKPLKSDNPSCVIWSNFVAELHVLQDGQSICRFFVRLQANREKDARHDM